MSPAIRQSSGAQALRPASRPKAVKAARGKGRRIAGFSVAALAIAPMAKACSFQARGGYLISGQGAVAHGGRSGARGKAPDRGSAGAPPPHVGGHRRGGAGDEGHSSPGEQLRVKVRACPAGADVLTTQNFASGRGRQSYRGRGESPDNGGAPGRSKFPHSPLSCLPQIQ